MDAARRETLTMHSTIPSDNPMGPQDAVTDPPRRITTFNRLRAIVDGGHLADMTGAEAKVLLAFVIRADYETGEAYPAMATLAADAGTSNTHRARQAVQKLERRGVLVEVAGSTGRSTKVRRVACPPPRATGTDSGPDGKCTGTETVPDGFVAPTGTVSDSNRDGLGKPTGTETVPRTHQNTSGNKPRNTPGANARGKGAFTDADLERIYAAYPKKAGKPSALKAIAKALGKISSRADPPADPVEWLLARVTAYAAERAGQDARFTKHPQGWFNDERYDAVEPTDDQEKVYAEYRITKSKGEFKETFDVRDLVIDPQ
jgi:hypothetical protein